MKPGTILITGARAPAALEWARQFAAEGWRVLAADSMPRPLASWSRAVSRTWRVPPARQAPEQFIGTISDLCRSEAVDVVLPVCEEIFTLARGADRLPAGTRLWAVPFAILRELHDKYAFMQMAGRLGLPVPETIRLTSREEVRALAGDWFLKPCYSRFAVAGRRWNQSVVRQNSGALHWLDRQEISPSRPWVAQEFLAGKGWCVYALAERGRVLSMVCYPVDWTAGAGACVAFTAQPQPGVKAWVEKFIAAAELSGQMAFDFIEVPGRGVLPLECNPRATSGIHLLPEAARVLTRMWGDLLESAAPCGSEDSAQVSAMLSVPMLLYGLPQAVRRGAAVEWLKTWSASREVTTAPGDAAPAWLGNAWTMAWFSREARRLRCGLTEATTADLEWNGDSTMSSSPE